MYLKNTCFSEYAGSFMNILFSCLNIEHVPFAISDKVFFSDKLFVVHKYDLSNVTSLLLHK